MYKLPEKKELTFRHLYGDRYAAFEPAPNKWELPKIIFPKKFQPEIGKKYLCDVYGTKTGEFVFENQTYRVCRAFWEEGSPFDAIDYKYHGKGSEKRNGATFGDLLQSLNIKDALPEKHVLLDLRVQPDRKHGGYMFVPEYCEADDEVDGKPSMRIFRPLGKVSLKPGQRYKARVDHMRNTERTNARGYIILEVGVTVL